ncbi:MAG: ABC transporter ATP-binding protein [Pseudomonadota bacterium]|jgi:ABC-type polysaccharide/polyol phosphate transport system ATPase subunit|uniref:ABC transporter, ATP-binding protein n=1 Tax=hydrothermal vent metagenome TaxID=652676 RepID=A0A160TGX7_9ZZZZ
MEVAAPPFSGLDISDAPDRAARSGKDETTLSISNLSKKYCGDLKKALFYGLGDIAGEMSGRQWWAGRLRPGEFWALDDISFDVRRGEAVAVIGRNGAGKSTLLRVIYGLLKPDMGQVRIAGRSEAIIELGTGFNPLLTGRENIEVGASLHGLDPDATGRLLEAVIDFAELAEFIDAPLLSYSSGMKARLAYSLAAHLGPDLLLVDEALAVGDLAFQHKCIRHMRQFVQGGGSLLLVSHNVQQIQTACDRAILLERGRVILEGGVADAVSRMLEQRPAVEASQSGDFAANGPVRMGGLSMAPGSGGDIRTGRPAEVTLRYEADLATEVIWALSIWTEDRWTCVCGAVDTAPRRLDAGRGILRCTLPDVPLLAGRYIVRATLLDATTHYPIALESSRSRECHIQVHTDPDPVLNLQIWANQLVRLDAQWDEPLRMPLDGTDGK